MTTKINGTGTAANPAITGDDTDTGLSFGTDTVNINTGGTTKATIDSSGNLIVTGDIGLDGQTSPTSPIHIKDKTNDGYDLTLSGNAISLNRDGASYIQQKGTGDLVFRTGSSNTERLRILNDGHFCVGRTNATVDSSNFGTSIGGAGIYVSRNVTGASHSFGAYGNQGVALIMGDGDLINTNGSYGSTSDETLKQDIVDAASQWDDIKNIKVRKFRFKDNPTGALQIGVVAQEIEKVSAGLVVERYVDGKADSGEKVKCVKYSVLHMKAVKALQEAMARIETLEAKVAALEAK